MLAYRFLYFLFIFAGFFVTRMADAKRGGGSGTSSGSRSGGILTKIKNTITGNRGGVQQRPQGTWPGTGSRNTIFKPKPAPIPSHNRGWMTGAGRSSYRMSNNKAAAVSALSALAGGFVGYKLGSALSHSRYHYGGRDYYYGPRYYNPRQGYKTCVFEVDPSTPNWNVRDPTDNSRVNEIIFECQAYETCCDMSCCRAPTRGYRSHGHHLGWEWWHTLLTFTALEYVVLYVADVGVAQYFIFLALVNAALYYASLLQKLTLTVFSAIAFACCLAGRRLVKNRQQDMNSVTVRYDEAAKPLNDPSTAYNPPYTYPLQPGYTQDMPMPQSYPPYSQPPPAYTS